MLWQIQMYKLASGDIQHGWLGITKLLLSTPIWSYHPKNAVVEDPNNATMNTSPEHIALSEQSSGERSSSESKDLVTSRTESTLYSSSRSESLWTNAHRSAWDIYQKPIIIMSIGGAFFLLGVILTAIYFVNKTLLISRMFGPVALSIGLMVLVVGLVWVPIIRKKRKQRSASRLFNHSRQLFFHF
ncbi:phosphoinositide-interacting protein [Discoglossus pictus]